VGALYTQGVAKTIASGLLEAKADPSVVIPQTVILAGLVGAIIWNLITWYYGIPSSSSHALMGGLCGAALTRGGLEMINWNGLTHKVLIPIFVSPVGGFIIAYFVMSLIYTILANAQPSRVNKGFSALQIFSSAMMAFSHGSNDAQKSMGVITMALVSGGLIVSGSDGPNIPTWVIFACAVTMAAGTSVGGWRIIKTMGHKIIKLEPVHGFAAETSASIVILMADHFHAPISTTHAISGSIFGVGAAKRLSAVRWGVARSMVIAWILTLPAAATVSGITFILLHAMGLNG
jgi:PiT family inorganic phosphate transporter